MLRLLLLVVLFIVVARVFWRVVDNVIEAASGRPPGGSSTPQRCGTFVLPERALSLADGGVRVYFCSEACRDEYRSRHRPRAQGRTA
jgi:hypothetical protein